VDRKSNKEVGIKKLLTDYFNTQYQPCMTCVDTLKAPKNALYSVPDKMKTMGPARLLTLPPILLVNLSRYSCPIPNNGRGIYFDQSPVSFQKDISLSNFSLDYSDVCTDYKLDAVIERQAIGNQYGIRENTVVDMSMGTSLGRFGIHVRDPRNRNRWKWCDVVKGLKQSKKIKMHRAEWLVYTRSDLR